MDGEEVKELLEVSRDVAAEDNTAEESMELPLLEVCSGLLADKSGLLADKSGLVAFNVDLFIHFSMWPLRTSRRLNLRPHS